MTSFSLDGALLNIYWKIGSGCELQDEPGESSIRHNTVECMVRAGRYQSEWNE